jgi:hypothetical protein
MRLKEGEGPDKASEDGLNSVIGKEWVDGGEREEE